MRKTRGIVVLILARMRIVLIIELAFVIARDGFRTGSLLVPRVGFDIGSVVSQLRLLVSRRLVHASRIELPDQVAKARTLGNPFVLP
jgi:hypothetical protein